MTIFPRALPTLAVLVAGASASTTSFVPEPPGGAPPGARVIVLDRDEFSEPFLRQVRSLLAAGDPLFAALLIDSRLMIGTVSDAERAELLLLRGEAALALGSLPAALNWWQSLADLYPDHAGQASLLLRLARGYRSVGAYGSARECLYRLINYTVRAASQDASLTLGRLADLTRSAGLELASLELSLGYADRAADLYRRLLVQNPGQGPFLSDIYHGLAASLRRVNGDVDEAERATIQALTIAGSHPMAWECLVWLFDRFGSTGRQFEQQETLAELTRRAATSGPDAERFRIEMSERLTRLADDRPWILGDLGRACEADPALEAELGPFIRGLIARHTMLRTKDAELTRGDSFAEWRSDLERERASAGVKLDTILR